MNTPDELGLQPGRNPFAGLLPNFNPDRMSQRDRVDVIRRLAGTLQASHDTEAQWLGRAFIDWLHGLTAGDLEGALGLKPPQGSHRTAPAVVAQERRDSLLLQLSAAVGSDRAALRLFTSGACPERWADLVAELASNPPQSVSVFTRARRRMARHHP